MSKKYVVFRVTIKKRIKMIHTLFGSLLDRLEGVKLSTYMSVLKFFTNNVGYGSSVGLKEIWQSIIPWIIAFQVSALK